MTEHPEGHYVTFHLNVKGGGQDTVFNGEVIMASGHKIGLADGSYFVRVRSEPDRSLVRGTIQREGTDKVIRFQSGDRVAEFVRDCLTEIPTTSKRGKAMG